MSRKSFRNVCFVLGLGVVFFGSTMIANATFLTADGDFAAETNGVDVGSNWAPWGWYAKGATASQSPFTNLFADNGMGALVAGGGYMVGNVVGAPTPITSGLLSFNLDFRYDDIEVANADAPFTFVVTNNADGQKRSLSVSVTQNGVFAESSVGPGSSLLTPVLGQWYNVQLGLNVGAGTYSGTITPYGAASVDISSRNFVTTQYGITCIFTDSENFGVGGGIGKHSYSVDNFALSTVVPEPNTLALLASGLLGLLAYAWRKRR